MPPLRCQPLPGLHRMGEPGTTIGEALERVPPIIENEAIITAVAVGAACLLILYFALAKRTSAATSAATSAVTSRKRTPSRSPSRSPGPVGWTAEDERCAPQHGCCSNKTGKWVSHPRLYMG